MVKIKFGALPKPFSNGLIPGGTYKYEDGSGVMLVTSDSKHIVIIQPNGHIRVSENYQGTIAVPAEVEIRTS